MHVSVRRLGRILIVPMVVAGVARTALRRRGQRADAELWAAATDAAGTIASQPGTATDGHDTTQGT